MGFQMQESEAMGGNVVGKRVKKDFVPMKTGLVISSLAASLLLAVLVSLMFGKYPIGVGDICSFSYGRSLTRG